MPIATEEHISPKIILLPSPINKRLIDDGLFYYEASMAGYAERYRRGETSHTIHVWWARRPHTSMRMLSFASLCKDSNHKTLQILSNLEKNSIIGNNAIREARETIKGQYTHTPKVLDMFAGGGTIPFEVANIGAQAYSIDSNELSIFIQKCNLIYSQNIDNLQIPTIIRESGRRALASLYKLTNELFPLRDSDNGKNFFGYIWTYSTKCSKCNYKYFLMKRPWLSKKKGKKIAFKLVDNHSEQNIKIDKDGHEDKFSSNWDEKSGRTICPKCKYANEKVNLKNTNDELIAVVKLRKPSGKEFIEPKKEKSPIPTDRKLNNIEKKILNEINEELPNMPLPKWSGIINPAIYGIETYSDFVNKRQRIILLMLIKALLEEYKYLKETQSSDVAYYAIGVLSSLLDQLIDWNCRLSMWISQNEQVGRAFCGPGVSMLWDYIETDPLADGPANLWKKLDRIVVGVCSIPKFPNKPIVKQAIAQKLPFENDFFDAVISDPPYYDNVYYTALADFFFSWKKLLLKHLDPELFSPQITNAKDELVASTFRNGDPQNAHENYCQQLNLAIREVGRVLKEDGVLSFIYSHSSIKGWESLVRAFRDSNLVISSVQPLSIERKHRPRGMTSEAINTCIVFVARKSNKAKPTASIQDIIRKITSYCNGFAQSLINSGWHEQDVALAVFAQGVGYLCNISHVTKNLKTSGVLKAIEQEVALKFKNFKIKDRKPL